MQFIHGWNICGNKHVEARARSPIEKKKCLPSLLKKRFLFLFYQFCAWIQQKSRAIYESDSRNIDHAFTAPCMPNPLSHPCAGSLLFHIGGSHLPTDRFEWRQWNVSVGDLHIYIHFTFAQCHFMCCKVEVEACVCVYVSIKVFVFTFRWHLLLLFFFPNSVKCDRN